jgi:two-component system sensor histidine kinase CpxA
MRSLAVRIALASFGTLLVSLIAFVATFMATSMPVNERLMKDYQARQVDDAVSAYLERGPEAAARVLEHLNPAIDATHYLTDRSGRDAITGADRSALLRLRRPWFGPPSVGGKMVLVHASADDRFRLIVIAPPPFNIWTFVPYYVLILVTVAFLCWLLALGIVRPLQRVAAAVSRFGRGDLSTRVTIDRRDEIGQLAHAFDDMADRIQTLVSAEKRLLQDISHELRSPLARLNIAIELARDAPDRQAATDRLQKESDRLTALVGSLIEVTRGEGDPAARRMERLSPAEIVAPVVEGCVLEASARGCRIAVHDTATTLVSGDAELLRRAVENVLRNAIRYAPRHSEITVDSLDTKTGVAIIIRDRGPGVPETMIPKLVEPFFRADEARGAANGGVGLGLSIAHRAIQLHRGSLVAENAHPGLRVTLTIPRAAALSAAS